MNGSYKAPREVTSLVGVVLFLLILAFSLNGYVLPWDQKVFGATIVTINIAKECRPVRDRARFLVNVRLHSSVFLARQYRSFAGAVHGQKSTDFIRALVDVA